MESMFLLLILALPQGISGTLRVPHCTAKISESISKQLLRNYDRRFAPPGYGCDEIFLPHQEVWKPDILFENTLSMTYVTRDIPPMQVMLKTDAVVIWSFPVRVKFDCDMELKSFPYDTQTCKMKLFSWTGDATMLKLYADGPLLGEDYVNEHEWVLVNTTHTVQELHYACCKEPFSMLAYTISLRRLTGYYTNYLVLPSTVITSLCIFGIFTPPTSGHESVERVTLGITGILTISIYLTMLSDYVPKTVTFPLRVLSGMFVGYEILLTTATLTSCVIAAVETRRLMRHGKDVHHILLYCLRIKKTARSLLKTPGYEDEPESEAHLRRILNILNEIKYYYGPNTDTDWQRLKTRLQAIFLTANGRSLQGVL